MKRREAISLLATLGLGTVALSSCKSELPQVPKATTSATPEPNLDAEQVSSVLEDLMQVVADADKAKDAKALAKRVKQPALNMRSGLYSVAKQTESEIPALEVEPSSVTVTESDSWPRAIVALTKPQEKELPAVLVVTQADARATYQLENWVRLFPGQSVATIAVSEGSPVVEPDSAAYIMSPKEALAAWVARLDGDETNTDKLGEDDFTTFYQDEAKRLKEGSEAAGKVTCKATPGEEPITAVVLGDGTAMVSAPFSYTVTYERTEARATLKVGGTAGKLLEDGPEVLDQPVRVTYQCAVLLTVPPATEDGKVSAIGAERSLQSVVRVEE